MLDIWTSFVAQPSAEADGGRQRLPGLTPLWQGSRELRVGALGI